ncbi:DNA polymerase subunit beta [Paramagnetospirillum kuznetsovii]|uniref:DNA polymerase subunit beta n=1 Tax=Paramagnetospirillum kuznetsovii TaxID=2053833 RepID=A0A364NTX1_9PROT|nr:nucleotidyltransferase domain-containing protein [Paramagnetospirillum kuznetsovii]RAU20516.1 DNA polymerase subunit beta [Paramagnetospirillum kuznetsovii]
MASARTLLHEKRDDILRLAALHGAANVRVFGSVARGDDRDDSDIDLLVHMDDGRSLLDMIRFTRDVQDIVGRKVDVISDGGISPYMRDRILAEARPL